MRVVRDGDFFKLARITGPTHNILSLRFGASSSPKVEVLDHDVDVGLSVDDVKKQVLEGVSRANSILCAGYNVAEIQFLRGDSPPVEIYSQLAFHLTKEMDEMTKTTKT